MQIFFIDQRQIRRIICISLIIVLMAGVLINWERISRRIFGVKPGVKLEGHLVQGMLPEEVAGLIKELALRIEREPRNAGYFPETGEIIAAQPGRLVKVAENVQQVCSAPSGASLKVMVETVPPKISEEYFKPVYRGNPNAPRVALAINVAWGEECLPEMLRILKTANVKATFFFVGSWIKNHPEMVREIAVQGHELANHGLYHGHPLQMNRSELKKVIVENQALLTSISGKIPATYFAPPYGELNAQVVSVAGELGYRTIMWTVDSVDWKNPAPEMMSERVLSKVVPGAIILFHPTVVTKTALPVILKSLRGKGLEPGTVSSVL